MWEVAEDNPEHIDFWRITINKVRQRQRQQTTDKNNDKERHNY